MLKPKQLLNQKGKGTGSNAKERKNLDERIAELETRFNLLMMQINQSFTQISKSLEAQTRVINAVVTNVGREAVQATVRQQQIEELDAQGAAELEAIAQAAKEGKLKVGETAEDDTVVVTTQYAKDGTMLHPQMVTIPLDGYTDEVKNLLKGKKAGDTVELADGGKIEIRGIYVPVPEAEWPQPAEPAAVPGLLGPAGPENVAATSAGA